MVDGKPGDNPLTDLAAYGIEVYGPEGDLLVREVARSDGRRRGWEVDE